MMILKVVAKVVKNFEWMYVLTTFIVIILLHGRISNFALPLQ